MAVHVRGREWEPPPRSLAADAHDCIMVRIQCDPPNTRLLWRLASTPGQAPLRSSLRCTIRRSAGWPTDTTGEAVMTSRPTADGSAVLDPVQDAFRAGF